MLITVSSSLTPRHHSLLINSTVASVTCLVPVSYFSQFTAGHHHQVCGTPPSLRMLLPLVIAFPLSGLQPVPGAASVLIPVGTLLTSHRNHQAKVT